MTTAAVSGVGIGDGVPGGSDEIQATHWTLELARSVRSVSSRPRQGRHRPRRAMLDLVGQLFAVAFVARICSAAACGSPAVLARVTAVYVIILCITSALHAIGAVPLDLFSLDLSRVKEDLQLWRLVTAFIWCDGLGLSGRCGRHSCVQIPR